VRFRRRLIVIAVLAAMAGCTRTVYVDRPVEVKVQVPVSCLEPRDVPPPIEYPMNHLERGASHGDMIGSLDAEADLREKMEEVLRGVLAKCVSPPIL